MVGVVSKQILEYMPMLVLLLLFLVLNVQVQAQELQAPPLPEQGSVEQKITLDVSRKKAWAISSWIVGYDRASSNAFMDDWYHTKSLSALTFNKDSFKIGDAFSSSTLSTMSKNIKYC